MGVDQPNTVGLFATQKMFRLNSRIPRDETAVQRTHEARILIIPSRWFTG